MPEIAKGYWSWNARLNNSSIQLGQSIEPLVENNIIHETEQQGEYVEKTNESWRITVDTNGYINKITFEPPFNLIDPKIWSRNWNEVVSILNSHLKPISSLEEGKGMDILVVISRMNFVAILMLVRVG